MMIVSGPEYPVTVKLSPGDPGFNIVGKFTVISRAGFEIDANCPEQYKRIIVECYNKGWLTPVAHMKESEYAWNNLST